MAEPTVKRPSMAEVGSAVLRWATAAAYKVIHADRCWFVRERAVMPVAYNADFALMLHLSGLKPDHKAFSGAGRLSPDKMRHLTAFVWSKSDLDPEKEDSYRLLNAGYGHFAFEDAVDDCLNGFDGEDGTGNLLFKEPMRQIGGENAAPYKEDKAWTVSRLVYQILYTPKQTRAFF